MLGCSMRTLPFFAPHDTMLTMLVCATCWLFMHLYTFAYMFMHESCLLVCRPYFNTMKSWTSNPNLHLFPHGHHLLFAFFLVCLLPCLFAFQFACLSCFLSCLLPRAMLAQLVCFFALCPLRIIYVSLSFHCLSPGFLSLPLQVHTLSKDAWGQGMVSQAQAKRVRMQACRYEPSGYVQYIQGSSLSHLVMYSFKPPFFLPVFLPQMGCIRYIMPCTTRPHLQSTATPV